MTPIKPEHVEVAYRECFQREDAYLGHYVAEYVEGLEKEREQLMLRSVAAMAIAEGDEGYEKVPIDCPMLEAVKMVRDNYNLAHQELGKYVGISGNLRKERDRLKSQLLYAELQMGKMREALMGLADKWKEIELKHRETAILHPNSRLGESIANRLAVCRLELMAEFNLPTDQTGKG